MDSRQQQLRDWAVHTLALQNPALDAGAAEWQVVAGDASTRRYFRLRAGTQSWICVDAPAATEKNREFLQVRAILAQQNIAVPALLAHSDQQGFLLLQDLGEQLLLPLLNPHTVEDLYSQALDTLFDIQRIPLQGLQLPVYSADVLLEELQRFPEWFCRGLLNVDISPARGKMLEEFQQRLTECAGEQPRVLVHRDFHSRNLIPQASGQLGVIDFQDAVAGPVCYDLVSLLKDCYIRWPQQQVRAWALAYCRRLVSAGLCPPLADDKFLRWFDWVGLQRHIKVLGNFSRLALRDGRDQYLADLPMVLAYVEEVLSRYTEFSELKAWFASDLTPQIKRQPWSAAP